MKPALLITKLENQWLMQLAWQMNSVVNKKMHKMLRKIENKWTCKLRTCKSSWMRLNSWQLKEGKRSHQGLNKRLKIWKDSLMMKVADSLKLKNLKDAQNAALKS